MAENLYLPENATKQEKYKAVFPQMQALLSAEPDLIANMANVAAVLKTAFNFLWVGFYMVKQNELVLAPFQGPIACTRIMFGKGVCGTAWQQQQTIIVPDVDLFPGHITCSSLSKSEIVLPHFKNKEVDFILDVDSEYLNNFDEVDQLYLTKIIELL